jgi:N-acetylmuramoyl-L-alanine amidase
MRSFDAHEAERAQPPSPARRGRMLRHDAAAPKQMLPGTFRQPHRSVWPVLLALLGAALSGAPALAVRIPATVFVTGQEVRGQAFLEDGRIWAPAEALSRAAETALEPSAGGFTVAGSGATVPARNENGIAYADAEAFAEAVGGVARRSGGRLDILARAADVRFAGGRLSVLCTLPVNYSVHRLSAPERVYVDLNDVILPGPGGETRSEKSPVRALRLSQFAPRTVRVAAETAGRLHYIIQSPPRARQVVIALTAESPAGGGEPKAASAPGEAAALRQDIRTIRSVRLEEDDDGVRFIVTADGPLAPQEDRDASTGQHWLDFEPALLEGEAPELLPQGRLLSAAKLVQFRAGVPKLRLVAQTRRVLATRVTGGEGPEQVIWSLSIPEGAGGDWKRKVVILDPGHGGRDTGARGNGLNEKDVNLSIALLAAEEGRRRGLDIVLTREKDVEMSLRARTDLISRYDTTLFVSIHNNSNTRPNSVSGTEVYYHMQDADSRALAEAIHDSIVAQAGTKPRGARSDSRLYSTGLFVLRNSPVPAALVEVGYINHSGDAARLKDPSFLKTVAKAIIDGIVSYLGGLTPARDPAEPAPAKQQGAGKEQ